MQAPLGLAVIGGLVMSTFATLLVLPSIFAVVIGRRVHRLPSVDPEDPNSPHFDPNIMDDDSQSNRDQSCTDPWNHAADGGDESGPAPGAPPLYGGP